MSTMDFVLQRLQLANQQITSDIIKDLIKDHAPIRTEMLRKYNAYKASGLPISSREAAGSNKANNKLINDFRGEIVDQVVGYIFGNPVTYSLNTDDIKNPEADPSYKRNLTIIKDFKTLNKLEELDGETGKFMSICGRAARLLYIDRNGKERVMDVPPWECIFIYDQSLNEVQYALRYYYVYEVVNGSTEVRTRVEWYDDNSVYYFLSSATGYMLDNQFQTVSSDLNAASSQFHLFDRVPLIDFQNNKECQGDFEKTESLIDGYDRLISDAQNEIEDFRQAYLLFYGVHPNEEALEKAKSTGAFGADKDDKIEYLTKNIND